MKFELVFVPFPGIGHLRSAVEIAKLLVKRDDRLSISILLLPSVPGGENVPPAYLTSLSAASNNRLRYEIIPDENQQTAEPTRIDIHIKNQLPKVRNAVAKLVDDHRNSRLPDPPRLAGFIVDLFCTLMADVANEFRVPSYLFYTSSAGLLGLGFHVQTLYDEKRYNVSESDYEDSDAELTVPSLTRPYPVKCLPHGLASKEWLPILTNQARKYREMKGILVNTVAELEPYTLKILNGGDTPPAYPVGPLLDLGNQVGDSKEEKQSEILEWLDQQPAKSVVFLCFGSLGGFTEEQAREIAVALERSGHRFVWSIRRASPPGEFKNLKEVLPEGFFDRTKERGRVLGWAPQIAVLSKPAVGGFVTHCGWNSTLESLWFGVPTAAWPLYSEQKFNAFEMVDELGLAVEIRRYWRNDRSTGIVTAEEIERAIKTLMEEDSDVRKRVKEMSEKCHVAVMDGGSSQTALKTFIDNVFENIGNEHSSKRSLNE